MPRWTICEVSNLLDAFEKCQDLLQSIDLGLGVTYLNIEESTIPDLEKIKHLVTRPEFFLRGKVFNFDSLLESLRDSETCDFFITSPIVGVVRTLSLMRPTKTLHQWCLIISGSQNAFELAKASGEAEFRSDEEGKFSLLYDSISATRPYLSAAMRDFRDDFLEGLPFSAAIYDVFEGVSKLSQAGAIAADSELKGHLGFMPRGAPDTNIDTSRILSLVTQLAKISTGEIRLSWQIVRLGNKTYEGWNLLSVVQDHTKARPASLEIYSLSSIPATLRRAIQRQLNL